MLRYFLLRLLVMVPTLLGVVTITFVIVQFVPGGPVEQVMMRLEGADTRSGDEATGTGLTSYYTAGTRVDPEQVQELQKLFGFDRPVLERYWQMMTRYLSFDLGHSYYSHREVLELVSSKLPVSITLGLWTFLLTYLISVPLGVAKAVRVGTAFDFSTSVAVLVGYAIPGFVLGILLIVFLCGGTYWNVFPLRGLTSENWDDLGTGQKVLDYLWHIALPVFAAVISQFAIKTMLTKNAFLEEIGKQYVLTARAKGLSERRVLWKHVFRNSILPLVTGFPAAFIAAFFTGSLLIETLFSLDGLGLLAFESIKRRDYPVVMGTLYLFTIVGLIAKLLGDMAYVAVDPRIRFDARSA